MPIVQNPSIGAGAAALLTTTTHLTSAQILALDSTPVVLIPAPGAGKLTLVFFVAVVTNPGAVAYTGSVGDDLIFQYGGGTADNVVASMTGLVTSPTPLYTLEPSVGVEQNSLLPGDDNQIIQVITPHTFNVGPIMSATLGAGGLGYAANDTGTITTGSGDATYQVLTVGAGGAVLTFSITAPGTAYTTGNGQATATGGAQPGVGLGFTVNITAVQTGDGTLKVVTYYQIITVP
jgi:hypothetical protein